MRNRRNSFFPFLYLFVLAFVFESKAQSPTSSPYSRFGMGDFSSNKIFAQSAGMAGTNIALKNDTLLPIFLNPANPASYTTVRLATFEVGVNSIFNQFSNNTTVSKSNNTTFNYLALGFPIRQSMGACIGVMPASSVGYKITDTKNMENIGQVTELYEGEGGINNLFLGLSGAPFLKSYKRYMPSRSLGNLREEADSLTQVYREAYAQYLGSKSVSDSINLVQKGKDLTDKEISIRRKISVKKWLSTLSIGANGHYYFGTVHTTNRVLYPPNGNFFNTAQLYQTRVNDFTGSFGIQNTFSIGYVKAGKDTISGKTKYRDLKEDIDITWGYTYSMNNSLRSYYSSFAYTFLYKGNGINEYLRDTIKYIDDQRMDVTLPVMHGIGISIRKGHRWNVMADYEMQLWSGFKYLNESSQFTDMKRISIGAEYIPNKLASTKGTNWKKIQFRLGAKYNDGKLLINNKRVNEYAVTAGFGFPVGMNRAFNTFNVAVEAGRLGSKDLVEQKYIQVKLGFTFNDRWFIKYKYD